MKNFNVAIISISVRIKRNNVAINENNVAINTASVRHISAYFPGNIPTKSDNDGK